MKEQLTAEELAPLPDGAVVLDHCGDAWQRNDDGRWEHGLSIYTSRALADEYRLTLLHPVPEPDHSMCARLVEAPDSIFGRSWVVTYPSGRVVDALTDAQAHGHGFAIPEPEPTVVERAIKVMEATAATFAPAVVREAGVIAQALAAAGLLVGDGEQA